MWLRPRYTKELRGNLATTGGLTWISTLKILVEKVKKDRDGVMFVSEWKAVTNQRVDASHSRWIQPFKCDKKDFRFPFSCHLKVKFHRRTFSKFLRVVCAWQPTNALPKEGCPENVDRWRMEDRQSIRDFVTFPNVAPSICVNHAFTRCYTSFYILFRAIHLSAVFFPISSEGWFSGRGMKNERKRSKYAGIRSNNVSAQGNMEREDFLIKRLWWHFAVGILLLRR